jgi:myosin-3
MQLKYTGVLETTQIRRLGYSYRIIYSDFVKRYSILLFPQKLDLPLTKESATSILNYLGLKNWKTGKTKLFLKYYHLEELSRLFEELTRKITVIQSVVRQKIARRLYLEQKLILTNSAIIIQRCNVKLVSSIHRCLISFVYLVFRKQRMLKIEQFSSCDGPKENMVVLLQACVRGFLVRRNLVRSSNLANEKKNESDAALIIQSYWRSFQARKNYRDLQIEQSTKNVQFRFFCQQVIKFEIKN